MTYCVEENRYNCTTAEICVIYPSGSWAINTDHASVLNRQPEDWMTWTPISVSLAWLGFHDVHTGIDHYVVNIGSQYMGSDLNSVSKHWEPVYGQ